MPTGLILTMGLAPDPLIFSIREQQADFVVFIGTNESLKTSVDETVLQAQLRPSQYDKLEIKDSPDEIGTLCELFQRAKTWLEEQGADRIVADPTGGRKWMSAGAVMVASFLGIPMMYVDSRFDRALGRVDPDSMKTVQLGNAYDQTGFIIAAKGVDAYNSFNFEQAASYFEQITPTNAHKQSLYSGLAGLCSSLARWDRFEHYGAKVSEGIYAAIHQIEQALRSGAGNATLAVFSDQIKGFAKKLEDMEGAGTLSLDFITDIFLNAGRRLQLNRFDDAIARHYRTLEAVSQFFLLKEGIKVEEPDYSLLTDEQRELFQSECRENILPSKIDLKLGFWLLRSKEHQVTPIVFKGKTPSYKGFIFEGILSDRNSSILAHGFKPIGKDRAEKFHNQLEELLQNTFQDSFAQAKAHLMIPNLPALGF